MRPLRAKVLFAIVITAALCAIFNLGNIGQANAVTIDFTTFPDGSPIPNETIISNQFESLGVRFQPLFPNSPRVLTGPEGIALTGILISGGPTGFFDDIGMEFIVPTTVVTTEIIGSGVGIQAKLEAFNVGGTSLGSVFHTYSGVTGELSPFTFLAPQGETIARVVFNGGLNPNAAASIGTLTFQPVPIPATVILFGTGLAVLLGRGWQQMRQRLSTGGRG
jgi:hypothetical protein